MAAALEQQAQEQVGQKAYTIFKNVKQFIVVISESLLITRFIVRDLHSHILGFKRVKQVKTR